MESQSMPDDICEQDAAPREVYRFGELFCGPGGLARAALDASRPGQAIGHQWATDYDRDTCLTYSTNIVGTDPNSAEMADSVICADIRDLDYQRLEAIGGIDALGFGFPCNDFSQVGERKGLNGTFGPLYKYGIQALRRFVPKWFVAENVGGIRAKNGAALRQILAEMVDAGYRVYPHYYKFDEYNVPQARHRMIVVGIRRDICQEAGVEFRVPSPEPYAGCDVSAETALADIPAWATNQEPTIMSRRVIARLDRIPEGGNAWQADLPEDLRINTKTTLSSIYRRLDRTKPAYTVTGGGGGGTHMYHWTQARALTNRERARLQTFPDEHVFRGKKESVRKQIGMAVPPRGAQVIFEAILDSLAGREYPSVPPSLMHLAPQENALF